MGLTLVSAPAVEPVTAEELRGHQRIDDNGEAALIGSWIKAATVLAEGHTGRAFVTQDWKLTLDAFPCEIRLPKAPLQSIVSVKYRDADGELQTMDAADYQVDDESEPARLMPAPDEVWPTTREQYNAVEVTFRCGYGAAADVPEGIKAAIKVIVGQWYEKRDQAGDIPEAAKALLLMHWTGGYG